MHVLLGSCIATIIVGLLIVLKLRAAQLDELTGFERRGNLFTPVERSFLGVLEQALDHRFQIVVNVCLGDLVQVPIGFVVNYRSAVMKMINQKFVDFVVCTAGELAPVGVLELDDRSRRRMDRAGRDEFVTRVLTEAGIPVLRFSSQKTYAVQELRSRLESMLSGEAKSDAAVVMQPPIEPFNPVLNAIMKSIPVQSDVCKYSCPTCAALMVKRQAVQEHSFGKYFWVCSMFPKCRQVLVIEEG